MKKAVVLLSGGLDSATVLAFAQRQGFLVHTISFDYGQRHSVEIACAQALAAAYGVSDHRLVKIDLRAFGGSALTSAAAVPKHRDLTLSSTEIPITYVPARNTIFLSFALALAEVTGSQHIFIGVNAVDYSGYPDCRPQYIEAFSKMANLATRSGVEGHPVTFHTPLMDLTKAQIIEMGLALGVDYALTNSCYDPGPEGAPCGACDSCLLRAKGFEEVGRPDPRRLKFGLA
jgi:7-cyano-7-deazaguanine synthase